MIKLDHVSKIYPVRDGMFYALNDVSLTIRAGEMVAVMGKSGAGKSTLLHIIGCLDTVSEGTYTLNGRIVKTKAMDALRRINMEAYAGGDGRSRDLESNFTKNRLDPLHIAKNYAIIS